MMSEVSGLFYYRLVFLCEIVISESMFFFKLKRKKKFILKLSISLVLTFLIAFFYPLPFYNFWYTSLMFIAYFVLTFIASLFLFDESISTMAFLSIASYLVQHISYQAVNTFLNLGGFEGNTGINIYGGSKASDLTFSTLSIFLYLFIYFIVYLLSYFLFASQIKKGERVTIKSSYLVLIVAISLGLVIFVNSYAVYNLNSAFSLQAMGLFNLVSMVCCFFVLAFQFKLLDNKNLQEEVDDAYRLLREERKQYLQSKNNVELINERVHDLKHQIRAIVENESLKEEVVDEMENAIRVYDSKVKTGNDVLDTILTEKSLECSSKNIKITCLLDGKALSFIDEIDLYTFFGNAIDNAIESVVKLEDEKRIISLTAKQKGNTVSLVLENYTENSIIKNDDGTIKSSKDTPFHGYGMKSMEAITEKYHGNLTYAIENGVFSLYALFVNE